MNLLENLKWRYATKQFKTTEKVSEKNLEQIKKAIQLSASSYGLQLYKVLIIDDDALKETLKLVSMGQAQITDASHLFVFCNYTEVNNSAIDEYLELQANTQQLSINELSGYGDFLKKLINKKRKIELQNWTARQTYLALGNLLVACAELKIDACPMEGFDSEKYNTILGLNERGLSASVIATIGYRSKDDATQYSNKIRKPFDKLFEIRTDQ